MTVTFALPAGDPPARPRSSRNPPFAAATHPAPPGRTVARVLPCWHEELAPAVRSGQRLLLAAHGNSLRALVKYLDGMSDQAVVDLNIPTGVPLLYEFDAALKPTGHRYLGDPEAIRAAADAVRRQTEKR